MAMLRLGGKSLSGAGGRSSWQVWPKTQAVHMRGCEQLCLYDVCKRSFGHLSLWCLRLPSYQTDGGVLWLMSWWPRMPFSPCQAVHPMHCKKPQWHLSCWQLLQACGSWSLNYQRMSTNWQMVQLGQPIRTGPNWLRTSSRRSVDPPPGILWWISWLARYRR